MHFSFETYVTFSKYKTISYLVFLIMFTCCLAMEMGCSFHFVSIYIDKQLNFVLSGYIMQNNLLELHCSCMSVFSGTSTKYLSNKKGIFIETIVSVMLLKILFNIGANISIIYKLKIQNRSTSLRETYVTFHSNHVTFI